MAALNAYKEGCPGVFPTTLLPLIGHLHSIIADLRIHVNRIMPTRVRLFQFAMFSLSVLRLYIPRGKYYYYFFSF